jgi:enoyl-CoA hydratase/carnithine racemase
MSFEAILYDKKTRLLDACWRSPEHAEGVRAFLEKRPPRFH